MPKRFAIKQAIILVSESPVTAINASISLSPSSSKKLMSLQLPCNTNVLERLSANWNALFLSFSINLIL